MCMYNNIIIVYNTIRQTLNLTSNTHNLSPARNINSKAKPILIKPTQILHNQINTLTPQQPIRSKHKHELIHLNTSHLNHPLR